MSTRMKRTQILFSEEQYRYLQHEAVERKCSIGALVRKAVAKEYKACSREQRLAAARRLVAMNLPVSDWPEMKKEIEQGLFECSGIQYDSTLEEATGQGAPDG